VSIVCLADLHARRPWTEDIPSVTAVGATQGVPETGAALSSGGFSNYFPMPAYQADAVNFYVGAVPGLNTSLFNASGRAFPDVSAYGKSVAIVNATQETLVDGTSASTPIFASVIALINDHLLANGKPPLGFLNPWLYTSNALTDVTDGNNPGCGTDGFPATIGWDPVAGLGSPNFTALLSAAGVDAW
jgi:tripeptidyl-peptidase-1